MTEQVKPVQRTPVTPGASAKPPVAAAAVGGSPATDTASVATATAAPAPAKTASTVAAIDIDAEVRAAAAEIEQTHEEKIYSFVSPYAGLTIYIMLRGELKRIEFSMGTYTTKDEAEAAQIRLQPKFGARIRETTSTETVAMRQALAKFREKLQHGVVQGVDNAAAGNEVQLGQQLNQLNTMEANLIKDL